MTEGRSEQVGGIALGLGLDTSGFSAGIARAKAELASLEATPVRVRAQIAVPTKATEVNVTPKFAVDRAAVSGFKAQIDEHMRGLGEAAHVPIQITLGRINYAAIRAEIAAGIGAVPIKITYSGKSSPTAIVSATVAEGQGESNQNATAFVRNAARKRGLEPRAMGGPVRPGGRYMVGEQGPEELTMHARGGYIRPMAGGGRIGRAWDRWFNGSPEQQEADRAARAATPPGQYGPRGYLKPHPNSFAAQHPWEYAHPGSMRTLPRHPGDEDRYKAGGGYVDWAIQRDIARGGKGRIKPLPEEEALAMRGVANLHALLRTSEQDPALSEAGRNWYTEQPAIHNFKGRATALGVTERQFTDVVAILSSGAEWYASKADATSAAGVRRPVAGQNITAAESVISHFMRGTAIPTSAVITAEMLSDAQRYIVGKEPMTVENFGPKRAEFAGSFWDPNRFVIDRWQGRATSLGARHGTIFPFKASVSELEFELAKAVKGKDWTTADAPSPGQRRASVYAGERVAADLGIEPRGVQAETWSEIKRLEAVGNRHFSLSKSTGLVVPRKVPLKAMGGYASEASALNRLREITHSSGRILPGFEAEAQAINLQIEQMRTSSRNTFESPWVRRMREQGTVAKEFRAGGGYVVGERGPELFVPKRLEGAIPPDVMARLPKRDKGGIVEIGQKPFSYFAPPEDGWIIPNHLRGRMPGRQDGGDVYSSGPEAPSPFAALAGFTPSPEPRARTGLERFTASARTTHTDPIPVRIEEVAREAGEAIRTGAGTGFGAATHRPGDVPEFRSAADVARDSMALAGRATIRGIAPLVLPSEIHAASDEFRRPGAGLISGRSSVRSAAANLGSFFLGGRQANEADRMALSKEQRDLRALESHGSRLAGAAYRSGQDRLDIEDRLARVPEGRARDNLTAKLERSTLVHERNTVAVAENEKRITEHTARVAAADKKAQPGGRNIAQNIFGIAAGTAGYQAISTAISGAFSAAMPAVEKWVDQMGGFSSTTSRVTSALADETAARHGNTQAAIAGAAATAGLSESTLDYVDATLKGSVNAKTGAKAAGQASDLLRASLGTAGGAPQGLYKGYGGIGGSAVLGEFLGGGKGYTETVGGDIAAFGTMANEPPTRRAKDDWSRSGIPGLQQIGEMLGGRSDQQIIAQQAAAPEALRHTIQNQNDAVKRGAAYAVEAASNLELTSNVTDDVATSFAAMGAAAGDGEASAKMAAQHVALIDKTTGQVVQDVASYQKYWEQAAKGSSIADPATVMRQQAQQLKATFAGYDAQLRHTLDVGIPAQIFQQTITNPLINPAAGIVPTGGLGAGGAGLSAGSQATVQGYLGQASMAQGDVAAQAAKGQAAMRAEVAKYNPEQLGEFNRELKIAQMYSDQIKTNTEAISLTQANLSAKQFSNQMYYLNRQLSDAQGLAGQAGGANNLGALQRQSFMIGREQTSLGLGLQQRQITTAVAVAGFQAPGESPEERYARREEALAKARIQQRQLNLSRRQFGVEGQIFNVQAGRGVGDAQRAIGMAQAEHNAAAEISAGSTAIANAEKGAAAHLSNASAIFETSGKKFGDELGVVTEYMGTYGGSMKTANELLTSAIKAMADPKTGLSAGIQNLYTSLVPTAGPTPPGPGSPTHAAGFLGMTHGATSMIVGEAGQETVAILRNPRAMAMGGSGGGGGGITIVVTGNTFSGREDEERLVQRITRAVEHGLGRKGQLMGLRGPAH